MSLSKVIEIARGELGVTESPAGSNRVKYWEDYSDATHCYQGLPWCVAFLWWVFQQAGERMAFFGGGKTASCGTLLRWYREQGLVYSMAEVKVGDIVILNFHGTKATEHCGLVTCVYDSDDGISFVDTIEGNTSENTTTSQDNGGCVALKRRYPSQIVAVCRPQYQPDPVVIDDVSGHWAEASIEWAREHGLIKGYPDGSFKPNSPLTRAEACAILERFYELLWENDMR